MNKTAKFNIGDCVMHMQLGYRAIVADIDPLFQASGKYNPQAMQRAFATRNPWYRLLVDESSQVTYVEECQLVPDNSGLVIDNPNLDDYLVEEGGRFYSCSQQH
ncbi:heat shock protein HspQ [Legionella dresdenensis]|uniref:Heat shock protein HspQ n=1 Tax=Legionella dresdenensis TaxID=450200 RepID=A0ABV8CDF0_9GAMM